VIIRQVASDDLVTSTEGLQAGAAEGVDLVDFSIGGWSGANVKLKAINFSIVPLSGTINTVDLTYASAMVLTAGNGSVITTSVNGSISLIGTDQTLTLTTPETVSDNVVTSPNFTLSMVSNSSTRADGSTADAFKVEIESVVLDINGTEATRILAGDVETSSVILTNVGLVDSADAYTTDEVITIAAGNSALSASYTWTQISGETVVINNSSTNVMTFEADTAGTYDFQLSYTRGGYQVIRTASVTLIDKPLADALTDLVTTSANIETQAQLAEAFEVFANFTTTSVTGQENSLVQAGNNLLAQIIEKGYSVTSAQLEDLFKVIDKSVSSLGTGINSASSQATRTLLSNFESLPVDASQVQVGFKILNSLDQNDTTLTATQAATSFNAIISALGNAANQSLSTSGQSSISIDSSKKVKFMSKRMNSGETTTNSLSDGSGSALVTVSISSSTLAELVAGGAGNILTLTTTIVEDTTSSSNLASNIYSIDVFETDGSTTSTLVVSGLTNKIEVKIAITDYSLTKVYEVRFRSAGSSTFVADSSFNAVFSNGVVTFSTGHLTEFAVFETDSVSVTESGGGGGCLLK